MTVAHIRLDDGGRGEQRVFARTRRRGRRGRVRDVCPRARIQTLTRMRAALWVWLFGFEASKYGRAKRNCWPVIHEAQAGRPRFSRNSFAWPQCALSLRRGALSPPFYERTTARNPSMFIPKLPNLSLHCIHGHLLSISLLPSTLVSANLRGPLSCDLLHATVKYLKKKCEVYHCISV